MSCKGVGVVWLKRDLRVADHAPLHAAAASGLPVVVLYIYEPSLLAAPDFGRCHLDFINQSLEEVHASLQRLATSSGSTSGRAGSNDDAYCSSASGGLTTRHAEAVAALAALHAELAPAGGIAKLWSHEETGTPLVTARNKAVAEWAQQAGVEWTELPQTGVTRNLPSRDGWARRWTRLMEAPMLPAPARLRFAAGVAPGRVMSAEELGVAGDSKPEAVKGGESQAQALLDSFLGGRAAGYSTNMSSPVTAWDGCSRLSPYLAWGCVSLRCVYQRTKEAADVLRAAKGKAGKPAKAGTKGSKSAKGGKAAGTAKEGEARAAKRRRGGDSEEEEAVLAVEEEDDEVVVVEECEVIVLDDSDDDVVVVEDEQQGAAAAGGGGAPAAQQAEAVQEAGVAGGPAVGLKDLAAFTARLRWRSHFMQKLEDEPDLVTRNMCRAYDGARDEEVPHPERFEAWCQGLTGYPMVDAVVRCLLRGGWINFRMRAMIFSFAAYHLWLHWRHTADFMAAHFVDYEPGIHYPQAQMQAGTTGINTFRVYSPSKQVTDHDKQGVFIKKYVPELANVPSKYLAEPWRMPAAEQQRCGCVIGRDYPAPIVQPDAGRENCRQLYAIKASLKAKEEAAGVYKKHGSRKRPTRPGSTSGAASGGGRGGGRSGGRGRGRGRGRGSAAAAPEHAEATDGVVQEDA